MAGVRYVGAGVLASAVGMDKHYMKVVLPVARPAGAAVRRDHAAGWGTRPGRVRRRRSTSLGYPVFVKPARGGSSIGISKVHGREGLEAAVEEARRHDPKVLVEVAAEGGREVECGVLAGLRHATRRTRPWSPRSASTRRARVLRLRREVPPRGAHRGSTCPPTCRTRSPAAVQELSVAAFEVLSCEGLARVDFFVLPDERVVINEINTMPGFTPSSMFPRMWAATGLDYPALVDRLDPAGAAPRHRPALSRLTAQGSDRAACGRCFTAGPRSTIVVARREVVRRDPHLDVLRAPDGGHRDVARGRPVCCASGMYQSDAVDRLARRDRVEALGRGTPQRSSIAGSPQAAPYPSPASASRRGWSATSAGSASTSAAQALRVGPGQRRRVQRHGPRAARPAGAAPEHDDGARAPRSGAPSHASKRRSRQMCTTGQVRVRVMPVMFCTLATTSLPSSSTLRASARTITS